jgi:hypothetical protein
VEVLWVAQARRLRHLFCPSTFSRALQRTFSKRMAWFIFPIRDILDRTSLLLAPRNWPRPGVNDQFREAWQLFRPEKVRPRTAHVATAASAVPPGEARSKVLSTSQDQKAALYRLRICIWVAQRFPELR